MTVRSTTRLTLEIKNIVEWKSILNAISDVTDEATFLCNDNGITFRGIDKAHIAYLSVTFPRSSFQAYEYQTSFFVLLVDDFKNLINSADSNATIRLQIEETEQMTIFIKNQFSVEFKLKLLTKDLGTLSVPRIEVKAQASISPNVLLQIIENIQKISQYVAIDCSANKIQFLGTGDIGSAKIEITKGDPELFEFKITETSSAIYSLEYLAKILQSLGKTCEKLSFEYASGTPIHFHFELPSKVSAEYYLSPRI